MARESSARMDASASCTRSGRYGTLDTYTRSAWATQVVNSLLVASCYYMLAADQLERWRQAVADTRTGAALAREVERARAKRYDIGAHESLKSAPRGYPKDHPRIEVLRTKGITVGRSFAPACWFHTKAALERILTVWRDAAAVNRWLDRNVGPSTLAPPEPR
jgi:uncharacterized protein (DUF2461 family)